MHPDIQVTTVADVNGNQTPLVIAYTSDFYSFKHLKANRDITSPSSQAHIKRLTKSFDKWGYLPAPIIVNENMEIIDGQHRLEAAKASVKVEQVPYLMIPGYGIEQVILFNSHTPDWKFIDFLSSYTKQRNFAEYNRFKMFISQPTMVSLGLTPAAQLRLFCCMDKSPSSLAKRFKEGLIVGSDTADRERILELLTFFKNVTGFTRYKQRVFLDAFILIVNDEKFNPSIFKRQVNTVRRFSSATSSLEYKVLLNKLYNFGQKTKSSTIELGDWSTTSMNVHKPNVNPLTLGGKKYEVTDDELNTLAKLAKSFK